MGKRKYLCEFHYSCPDFNKLNIVCRENPWICGYWKLHFESLQEEIDTMPDTNVFDVTNLISKLAMKETRSDKE
jgi:hypothetical protein